MKRVGWRLSALAGGALLTALVGAGPAGMSAQQSVPGHTRLDRRCVDRSGEDIPNCACFGTPQPGDFVVSGFGRPATRARLGITVSATQDAADDAEGARVQSVLENGPADSAGIRRGDIITSVEGKSLSAKLDPAAEREFDTNESLPVQRLLSIASDLDPDTSVPVRYLRDGTEYTATVHTRDLSLWDVTGALPGVPGVNGRIFRDRMDELRDRLDSLGSGEGRWDFRSPGDRGDLRIFSDSLGGPGIVLREPRSGTFHLFGGDTVPMRSWGRSWGRSWHCPGADDTNFGILSGGDDCIGGLRLIGLNPGLASYFKTDKGVLVSDVDSTSATGLEPGDIIEQIGGRDAETPARVRRILATYSNDEKIDFHIVRKGKAMDVTGRLGG